MHEMITISGGNEENTSSRHVQQVFRDLNVPLDVIDLLFHVSCFSGASRQITELIADI